MTPLSSHSFRLPVGLAALLLLAASPGFASLFGKDKQDIPQWGLDAAKTPTPAYAKDAPAVVLFDEYLITVDDQNQAVERERFAVRILQPQGRMSHIAQRGTTSTRSSITSAPGPLPPTAASSRPWKPTSSTGAYAGAHPAVHRARPHRQSTGQRPRIRRGLRDRGASPALYERGGMGYPNFHPCRLPKHWNLLCLPAAITPSPGASSPP
jgi:hypothetical protein